MCLICMEQGCADIPQHCDGQTVDSFQPSLSVCRAKLRRPGLVFTFKLSGELLCAHYRGTIDYSRKKFQCSIMPSVPKSQRGVVRCTLQAQTQIAVAMLHIVQCCIKLKDFSTQCINLRAKVASNVGRSTLCCMASHG
mmetsp:Transcript_26497/g.41980  ORF Transcript_26497/g.41980 Transcript_26497/m.41980 type:complete len:138 (-) Transcript_26497:354-767(-)